jgi:hypothetical protein
MLSTTDTRQAKELDPMRRLTSILLLLSFGVALALLVLTFPSSIPRAADVTLTPDSFVYLPFIARPALPTSTPTATPTQTPTATPTTPAPPTGDNVHCEDYAGSVQVCAWVSNGSPSQYSTVTVSGRLMSAGVPIAGAPMHTVWHYMSSTATEDCVTGSDGIGRCSRNISRATKGYKVTVNVTITYQSSTYSTYTSFTPQ